MQVHIHKHQVITATSPFQLQKCRLFGLMTIRLLIVDLLISSGEPHNPVKQKGRFDNNALLPHEQVELGTEGKRGTEGKEVGSGCVK